MWLGERMLKHSRRRIRIVRGLWGRFMYSIMIVDDCWRCTNGYRFHIRVDFDWIFWMRLISWSSRFTHVLSRCTRIWSVIIGGHAWRWMLFGMCWGVWLDGKSRPNTRGLTTSYNRRIFDVEIGVDYHGFHHKTIKDNMKGWSDLVCCVQVDEEHSLHSYSREFFSR